MKFIFSLLLILLSCNSLFSQDCNQMPRHFSTYESATAWVKEANFSFTDKANTSKSSWIRSAAYYSCDGKIGFFIFSTDSNEYIHANMPISVWYEFKNAESFGKYYNANIKHKFKFSLN